MFARLLWNSLTAGLSSASFCWIAIAVRYSPSASLALPVSASSWPSQLTVTARSLFARSVAPAASASASWSARARRSIDRASAVWPVSFSSQPSRRLQIASAARTAAEAAGPAGPATRCSASRYAASAWLVLPVNSSSRPTAVEATADVCTARSSDPGSDASASRSASTLRCAASASSSRPTLRVSEATSKFACASASREAGSAFAAQDGRQLAVEVGRRLEQPVAQLLELVLLQQEVLADAGVERS